MNFNISKNGWLILGTALIIGVAFSIYFLVYVKDREKALIENNFRVLQQIRENIKTQENYYKNAFECSKIDNDSLHFTYEDERIVYVDTMNHIICNSISYDDFFNNDLLIRKDVFDYIIVSKYDPAGEERKILHTNAPGNVADSVFQQENLASYFVLNIAANDYVSFNQNIDRDIYISGLVNEASFSRQKRGVSLFVIIIFSVILVFIILNMPLIKMKIMSRTESMNASDVMLSGVSILMGSGVLLILLLSGLIYFVSERSRTHTNLETLSYRLEELFTTEMTNIINQLEQISNELSPNGYIGQVGERKFLELNSGSLDSLFQKMAGEEEDMFEIGGYRMYHNVLGVPSEVFSIYRHFNYIFWCDSSARALIFLTPFNNPRYVQDLSHRKYLTHVIDGNQQPFRRLHNQTASVGFESIKSVNDGTYEVGIGINSGDPYLPILAMSTKLLSVMDPVLPEGYGFCILDDQGNTEFHSNIQKNMNENFVSETLKTFQPALTSKTKAFQNVTYGNQKYIIHFRPMNCMPGHYLATFTTEEAYNTPYSLALYNSLLLFLGFLVFLGIIYLIFYFIVFRENKLQRSGFLFDWLRPFETLQHYYRYRKLFRLNMVTILYLLISSRIIWYERDILVNNLLLTISVLLICSFHYLYVLIPGEIRLTSHLTRTDGKQKYFRILFLSAGAILILLLLVNRVSLILNYSDTVPVFWKEIIILLVNLALIFVYIHSTGIHISKYQPEFSEKSGLEKKNRIPLLYQGYLFSWVIIISAIPIHVFFGMSYDIEKEILIKYKASRTFDHYSQWDRLIDDEFSNNFIRTDYEKFKNSMKEDGFHLILPSFLTIKNTSRAVEYPLTARKVLFDSIYGSIRPFYNQLAFQSNGFIKDQAYDRSWLVVKDSSCTEDLFPMCRKMWFITDNTTLEYTTSGFFDLFTNGWRIILIFLPAAMLIYFKLIQFSSKRIYGFKFKKFADSLAGRTAGGVQFIFSELCTGKQLNHLFYVSLDNLYSSPADEAVRHTIENGCPTGFLDLSDLGMEEISIRGLDLSFRFDRSGKLLPEEKNGRRAGNREKPEDQEKPVIILVDHFEHQFKDPELNQLKYNILNSLIKIPGIRLAVFSAVNIQTFFDYYRDAKSTLENRISKKMEEKDRQEFRDVVQSLDIEVSRWQVLMGKFVEIAIPLRKNEYGQEVREDVDYLLEEELNYSKYLKSQYPLLKRFKSFDDAPDDMVCRTEQVSGTYYLALWNMLSRDEKMLVHDIARNKFVNTKDSNGVFSLLNKGIFIYDHSLRSMNESFSNFVLSRMSQDDEMEKELETRKKGAWNTTFIILLLVIVSLVAFLSIGQLSFLNDINSLFTSLGALLAIILRFGGFFSAAPK